MIKCPECNITDGITAVNCPGPRDALSYQFECSSCRKMWRRTFGIRKRESYSRMKKEMENVEVKPPLWKRDSHEI